MADFITLKAYGAINTALSLSKAVADGDLTPVEQLALVDASRMKSGELDPRAVTMIEELAKQMNALAKTLRATATEEAIPIVKLADYPITMAQFDRSLLGPLVDAISQTTPLWMSAVVSPLGSKQRDDGGFDIIASVHGNGMEPKDGTFYRVSLPPGAKGKADFDIDDFGTADGPAAGTTAERVRVG